MKLFRLVVALLSLALVLGAGPVLAEGDSYLQVEAQPTLDKAMDRARSYAADFTDVQGFRTPSGWYAIVLGPMTADDAANRLVSLRGRGLIATDSYLVQSSDLRERFWPVGETADAASDSVAPEAPAPLLVEETRDEALAAEAALGGGERAALQEALKWYGFYDGALDGAIGKGTRKSMAGWQDSRGYEATGVLTTIQRAELIGAWKADKAEFGFETVTEAESGIEITLPLGLVAFDGYAPPFVLYSEKAGSGLTIRLISEPGDAAALSGLFDVLQSLDVMPAGGQANLGEDSFALQGKNARIESRAYAKASRGAIKGYLISWTPALDDRIGRILPVIEASFRSLGAAALDPGLVPLDEAVRRGLVAGLEAKAAKSSQSGLFVSADGAVVTAGAGLAQCGALTIERDTPAGIVASDPATGLVLLKPQAPIAPQAYAGFAHALPQKGAEVTAVGWSYGDRLPAPVMNPGILQESAGLDGRAGVMQLGLTVLPGDAGGPVLDAAGAVIGLVLPGNPAGPALPPGLALALDDAAVTGLMAQAQLTASPSVDTAPLAPDALAARGLGMTALVSCWD